MNHRCNSAENRSPGIAQDGSVRSRAPSNRFLAAGRLGQGNLKLDLPYYAVSLVSISGDFIPTLSGLSLAGACPFHQYQASRIPWWWPESQIRSTDLQTARLRT